MDTKHVPGETLDIKAMNIQNLKALFPEAFTEGKIDFDKLKQLLGEYVDDSTERYNFTWNGKGQSLRFSQSTSTGTLRPCPEESKDWDTTNNLYIEGDNLEVLKLLQKSYFGKVKMIYIDPPYNTGNDFVYPDDFKDSIENYKKITGQVNAEGNALSTNTESNGRYHTDWLNMMYPRLRLARNLLRDDGVIYISIDDNEVGNLRKAADEVFGEENFISNLIWQKKFSRANDATYFSTMHDHILCYSKSNILLSDNGWTIGLLPRGNEIPEGYNNPDNDPRGVWTSVVLSAKSGSEKLLYQITSPGGSIFTPPSGRYWSVSESKLKELINDNRIWFGVDGNGSPRLKTFLSEVQNGLRPNTILFQTEVGHNQEGKQETKSLFNDIGIFDGPKPIRLLNHLSLIANTQKDSIILDFFSGSATTAHAVMKLNVSDGGHRKYIMVQLPEKCDEASEAFKAGYKTICEIGKERIRRAGEKIKQDNPDAKDLDLGFKVLKLDTSNIKRWNPDAANLETTLEGSVSNWIPGRTDLDVVYEILIKLGLPLDIKVEHKSINGKTIYTTGSGALIVCLADGIDLAIAKKIIEIKETDKPETCKIVFRDNGFKTDSDKTNVLETLRAAGIEEILSI